VGYRLEEFAAIDGGVAWLRNVDECYYFYSLADKNAESMGKDLWDAIFILLCIW